MSDFNSLQQPEVEEAAAMSQSEKFSFWLLFFAFAALTVFSLVLCVGFFLQYGGQLQRQWGRPGKGWMLLTALLIPVPFTTFTVIALIRMWRRKLKSGSIYPSGKKLEGNRARRDRVSPRWKTVIPALGFTILAIVEAGTGLESSNGSILRWAAVFFCSVAALGNWILLFKGSEGSDEGIVRLTRPLFGEITYIEISSLELQQRIRARYAKEINQLNFLGFNLLFWEGETFSVLSLLLLLPAVIAITMLCFGEVMTIMDGRIVIGEPILTSPDRSVYASLSRMGAKFRTAFLNGIVLNSSNLEGENSDGPEVVRRYYKGETIEALWAAHQQSVRELEAAGNVIDRQISFDAYVRILFKSNLL